MLTPCRWPGEAWRLCTSTRMTISSSVSAAVTQPHEQVMSHGGTMGRGG
jgi:hypothetical protein